MKVIRILSFFFAFTLLAIPILTKLSPDKFWLSGIVGLFYPVVILINILFALFFLLKKEKTYSLIPIISLLLAYPSISSIMQFNIPSSTKNSFSVLSWNVKNFDLYNWTGNTKSREKILQLLEQNRANIMCLQEFYTDSDKYNNLNELKKRLKYPYISFIKTYSKDSNKNWGLIILSDYKIVNNGKITFTEGTHLNSCIYTDILIYDSIPTRVYNIHLQSNQLNNDDFYYLDSLVHNKTKSNRALSIASKLKQSYIKRSKQVIQTKENIKKANSNIILCGDFNDTPISYTYNKLSFNLKDSFKEKGIGFGKSFKNPTPFLRIDYILHSNKFTTQKYQTLKGEYSDHYPIKSYLKVKN